MLKKIGHFLKITTLAYIIYSLMISAFNITRFSVREFSLTSLVLDFAVWVVA